MAKDEYIYKIGKNLYGKTDSLTGATLGSMFGDLEESFEGTENSGGDSSGGGGGGGGGGGIGGGWGCDELLGCLFILMLGLFGLVKGCEYIDDKVFGNNETQNHYSQPDLPMLQQRKSLGYRTREYISSSELETMTVEELKAETRRLEEETRYIKARTKEMNNLISILEGKLKDTNGMKEEEINYWINRIDDVLETKGYKE